MKNEGMGKKFSERSLGKFVGEGGCLDWGVVNKNY